MSPRLREIQRDTLAGAPVIWHASLDEVPEAPTILIANEFFDALPIRQFVGTAAGWAERVVGLGEDGGLTFGLRPIKNADASPLPTLTTSSSGLTSDPLVKPEDEVGKGTTVELSPASAAIASILATRLARNTGAALIIDYGYESPAAGDTLQAVARHRYVPPLESPGEADLTAHVDFTALADAARTGGAEARPLLTQGQFLARLGLAARAATLKRDKDPATSAAVDAAAARLAGPEAMGNLFKVLAVSSRGLVLPAFEDKSGP
jgi:NADH dehydrogenase [ubiquinone] 1 alpha subcomplex assembly factor 7